jgi:type IV pilus assembly protein PilP
MHTPKQQQLKSGAFKGRRIGLLAACVMVLAGCSSGEFDDLQTYVKEVKARPPGRIAPIPEFETYETVTYNDRDLRDPFVPKEEVTISRPGSGGPGFQPDKNRRKETLESFPLDSLKYVGSLENRNDSWAIIKAPDNLVYRAKVGNHLGLNYGEITAITEGKVQITEVIPDGVGGWVKRQAALAVEE